MTQSSAHHPEQTIAHFRHHGWMHVPQAIGADAIKAMQESIWQTLAKTGIMRDHPSSWTIERPSGLQALKDDPAFQAVASDNLRSTIHDVLDGAPYDPPANWGALFLAFPSQMPWHIPTSGWHADACYTGPYWPIRGVKTFTLLNDLAPRGGGTLFLSGSHRLIHRWFADNSPPPGTKSAELRKSLRNHPYIRDLHTEGDVEARIARFMDRTERMDGIALQVIEQTGHAGDIMLVHPLLLHVAAPNGQSTPRMLLSGGVTTDNWGWCR